jgi:hypothetical protein
MFRERDLVRLILQLNPYAPTPNPPPNPFVPTMIFCPPPVLTAPQIAALHIANDDADVDSAVAPDLTVFNFETQDNPAYQLAWTWHFKGQDRIIRRALRFPYRYPIQNGGGTLATDYVLIGYEGGGGP